MKDGWFGQRKRDEMRGIRPDFSGVSLPAIKLFRNFCGKKRGATGKKSWLAAEAADHPEQKAEDDTDEDGACERERDAPASAAPGEIAGQSAERNVEAVQQHKGDADSDKEKAEKDEDAAQI
jgi:hypothetical protein